MPGIRETTPLPRYRHARATGNDFMSDVSAAPATSSISGIKLPGLGDIAGFLKRGDIGLAIGVLTILVVLILPLPPRGR